MPPSSVDKSKRLQIVVFFTWDVSLRIWQTKGLLEREFRLYDELSTRGIDFTFVTWGNEADFKIATAYPQFDFIPAYTIIPCPRSKILRALTSLILPFRIKSRLKDADIIKTNQMWGAWVAVILKWIIHKPLILRCGFELYDFTVKSGASKLRQSFIKFISYFCYKNADRVFVATNHDKYIATRIFKVKENRITLRPNWIDTAVFKPVNKNLKNRLLYVGRLSLQKNLKMLIDACAAENIALDIYGKGELQEELTIYAREKGADIAFKGSVANNKLPDIYASYRAYILCSHYEGNPKTLLEAMACGALVIGTKVDGIESIITDQHNGLLCDKTPESLRRLIARVMKGNENFDALKHQAAQKISKNYSLNASVDLEMKIYKEIMND